MGLEPWFCAEFVLVVNSGSAKPQQSLRDCEGFGHVVTAIKKRAGRMTCSLFYGGREGTRTPDLLRVKQAL